MLGYRHRERGPETEALDSINRNQWGGRMLFLKEMFGWKQKRKRKSGE
jgi:hypothetical protein